MAVLKITKEEHNWIHRCGVITVCLEMKRKVDKVHTLQRISAGPPLFVGLFVDLYAGMERIEWALNEAECSGVEIWFIFPG